MATVGRSPTAPAPRRNDNATGVATLLALARRLANIPTRRTIRFVAFANEEPPFFQTAAMAAASTPDRAAREAPSVRVVGMGSGPHRSLLLATPERKRIPLSGLVGLPDRPDYVAFLGNASSRRLARRSAAVFNQVSAVKDPPRWFPC